MSGTLDGNTLAGQLRDFFAFDITSAVLTCAGCGSTGPAAEVTVYLDARGAVARCASCGSVVLRLARGGGRGWLDLRGTALLSVAIPDTGADAGPRRD